MTKHDAGETTNTTAAGAGDVMDDSHKVRDFPISLPSLAGRLMQVVHRDRRWRI